MKLHALVSIVGLSFAIAVPAFASSHGPKGQRPKRVAVLLDPPSHRQPSLPSVVTLPDWVSGVHARNIERKAFEWNSAKFDRWLAHWLAVHKPRPPLGGGGGPVVVPPGAPPSAMPEPSAALLFPLGTGLVALVLRRGQGKARFLH